MSSTYRVLCLSHDPAATHGEYRRPEDAEAAIRDGLEDHPTCDLMIGRYSYPLVELGCPPTRDQRAQLSCHHGSTVWVDRDWIRLLVVARESSDPDVQATAAKLRYWCLSSDRLHRLRIELGTSGGDGD